MGTKSIEEDIPEITPEMVEAGADVLLHADIYDIGTTAAETLALAILRRALTARRSGKPEGG